MQILLRTIVTERAFICKQLSPGMLLKFFQKQLVFPNICIYMHIFKPRTRFTTSNEVVYLNPDLHPALRRHSLHIVRIRVVLALGRFGQFLGWVVSALVGGSFRPILEVSCFGPGSHWPKSIEIIKVLTGTDFRFDDSILVMLKYLIFSLINSCV